jgi:predicted transcriptional regulator
LKTTAGGAYTHRYRSKLEIVALVLGIASSGPTTRTRLMYGAYLSHDQFDDYLKYLLSRGLLAATTMGGRRPSYSLTEKGLKVLRASETVVKLLRSPPGGDNFGSTANARQRSMQREQGTASDDRVVEEGGEVLERLSST